MLLYFNPTKFWEKYSQWYEEECDKRCDIAAHRGGNTTCPICGKELKPRESTNGIPLVNSRVCYECDKRYIYTFRCPTLGEPIEIVEKKAVLYFQLFMKAELSLEVRKLMEMANNDHSLIS